jgi:hypothetical protein
MTNRSNTRTRNTRSARNGQRRAAARNTATTAARRPVNLSRRGKGAVAVTVAVLILLAGHGFAGPAMLAGLALYGLVTGGAAAVAALVPSAAAVLRGLAWSVVAVATVAALQGSTAPGGPLLGLALAAALGTYLKLTAKPARRRRS